LQAQTLVPGIEKVQVRLAHSIIFTLQASAALIVTPQFDVAECRHREKIVRRLINESGAGTRQRFILLARHVIIDVKVIFQQADGLQLPGKKQRFSQPEPSPEQVLLIPVAVHHGQRTGRADGIIHQGFFTSHIDMGRDADAVVHDGDLETISHLAHGIHPAADTITSGIPRVYLARCKLAVPQVITLQFNPLAFQMVRGDFAIGRLVIQFDTHAHDVEGSFTHELIDGAQKHLVAIRLQQLDTRRLELAVSGDFAPDFDPMSDPQHIRVFLFIGHGSGGSHHHRHSGP